MSAHSRSLLILFLLLSTFAIAKDKDKTKNKSSIPTDILRARTVLVAIDPDAGEPLDQPNANAIARDNVERALLQWGRFELVLDGQESDLVIAIRTGNGKSFRPTIKGGPLDRRPGVAQSTDGSIRIGAQQGQPPFGSPDSGPQDRGPRIGNEVGPPEDSFAVYRGRSPDPLYSSPVWRYQAKDCLRAPAVSAVEEFRKALAQAEKPQLPPQKP